jgi:hypothetical protein
LASAIRAQSALGAVRDANAFDLAFASGGETVASRVVDFVEA